MSIHDKIVPCPCGSNEPSYWLKDGYGIELCRACPRCERARIEAYRPDIMERYEASEPIDEE
jgi:hypothetical protein